MTKRITRRAALKTAAGAALTAPFLYRKVSAQPTRELVRVMAVGAGGRGAADIAEMAGSKAFALVAFADVDLSRAAATARAWPKAKAFTDYRKMFDEIKDVDAVSVSTPDHSHAPAAMRALHMGKPVCCQKPLTHSLYEARQLAKVATEKKLVTQMGIQIHSAGVHKQVIKVIQDGTIGKVKEVHSWSGKDWGDRTPKPDRTDPVPKGLEWDLWIGTAADRPYIAGGYYHPGNWRKRLDFGCGTFGDMGCHILDPVFGALALTYPLSVKAIAGGPTETNWGLDNAVEYVYPGTKFTAEELHLTWYDGKKRPPAEIVARVPGQKLANQGSIFIGSEGVLYSAYDGGRNSLYPAEKFRDVKLPAFGTDNHYAQFVEAVRGNGQTSTPFSYAGPLTELVLIGCLATRFQNEKLVWDSANMKVTNVAAANQYVKRTYRKGWEVEGL